MPGAEGSMVVLGALEAMGVLAMPDINAIFLSLAKHRFFYRKTNTYIILWHICNFRCYIVASCMPFCLYMMKNFLFFVNIFFITNAFVY